MIVGRAGDGETSAVHGHDEIALAAVVAREIRVELRHALVSVLRHLRHRALDDHLERGGDRRLDGARAGRVFGEDRGERGGGIAAIEGALAGDRAIENGADRVDVGAMIDALSPGLFGRHVRRRAHDHARLRERSARRVSRLRNAEVDHLRDRRAEIAGEEDVLRLHVAVDDVLRVRGLERFADLPHHARRGAYRHPPDLAEIIGELFPSRNSPTM